MIIRNCLTASTWILSVSLQAVVGSMLIILLDVRNLLHVRNKIESGVDVRNSDAERPASVGMERERVVPITVHNKRVGLLINALLNGHWR